MKRRVVGIKDSVILLIISIMLAVCAVDKDDQKGSDNQTQEKKSVGNVEKRALLEEIGTLKGELREFLNEAEKVRKKILSKMYGTQARKAIVEKVKDFITPAQELLDKCKEKEENVCVTPKVIEDTLAKIEEEERMKKFEEERAKMEEQIRKQQQQQSPPSTGNPPLPPPSTN